MTVMLCVFGYLLLGAFYLGFWSKDIKKEFGKDVTMRALAVIIFFWPFCLFACVGEWFSDTWS